MRSRRTFRPKFKKEVIESWMSGTKTLKDLCQEYGLNPAMVSRWKKKLLARTTIAGVTARPEIQTDRRKTFSSTMELKAEIADLYLQLKKVNQAKGIKQL